MTQAALLSASVMFSLASTPQPTWELANQHFQQGLALQEDALKARPHFAHAAECFDQLWLKGPHSPQLALARGRAHFLSGDYPHALVAFRQGLLETPHDAELQTALELARDRVEVPPGPAEERLRQPKMGGLRSRVTPWDALALGSVGALLVVVGLARRFTQQDSWSMPLAVFGVLVFLTAVAGMVQLLREEQRETEERILVVRTNVTLRKGNGESYRERIHSKIPRGAEVKEISKRGDWVQVQLAGGVVGWIPEVETIPVK